MKNNTNQTFSTGFTSTKIITDNVFLLLDNNTLLNAIDIFFRDHVEKGKYYFVLLKLIYENNNVITLHKGVVIDHTNLAAYKEFCIFRLSHKSNDYISTVYHTILFDHFTVDEKSIKNNKFNDKWGV